MYFSKLLHVNFSLVYLLPRAIPVPPQTAPPPRMVNLCQASQTTIIAPNPMLQGALLMQQMQGTVWIKTTASGRAQKHKYKSSIVSQTAFIYPPTQMCFPIIPCSLPGNMRSFGMGGQQFRQFYAASARSSLLGPVPMGMAIKSPIMGFPAARPFHPHARYYNNNTTTASSSSSSSITVITTVLL